MKAFYPLLILLICAANQLCAQVGEHTDHNVYVAGKSVSGSMKVADIKRSGGVLVKDESNATLDVLSFDMVFTINDKMYDCHTTGYNFSAACKKYIDALNSGDKLKVYNVRYRVSEGAAEQMGEVLEFNLIDQ